MHHDTHEVFSLQVAGEKRWLVYEPVLELPLRDQRYRSGLGAPGEPVLDVTLRAGDTLYLPRGWLHQAMTSGSDSLHITVGVNVYTWLDAVRAALEACAQDVEFRRAARPEDAKAPEGLLARLLERLGPDDLRRRQRRRLLRSRRPVRDGQITSLRALEELTADTHVEPRRTVLAEITAVDGSVSLAFEGKTLVLPAHAREELEALAGADGPVRASDLPGDLDEAGRLVLVRRLVREGFLRVSD